MNMTEIISKYKSLNFELKRALATMERKDNIREIREQIIENQRQCPHISDEYNWAPIENACPYCGFEFPKSYWREN